MTARGSVGVAVVTSGTQWGQPDVAHSAAPRRAAGVDPGAVSHSLPPSWRTLPPHFREPTDLRGQALSPDPQGLYDDFHLLFVRPIISRVRDDRCTNGGRTA